MMEGGGLTSLPNIFQNYKLDKVEMNLHTVYTEGGYGQLYKVYLAPWNRPSQRAAGETARVKPNLLPGCQFKIFDTQALLGKGKRTLMMADLTKSV